MLERVPQLLDDEVWVQVEARGRAFGHRNPWPSGTIVRFADHMSAVGGQGFRRLGVLKGDNEPPENYWTKLPFETRGIVTHSIVSYVEYDSRINVEFGRLKETLHLWYYVAFEQEMLWVRCDWLVPA